MAREMKDSGIEWIGEIPKHWSVKKNKYLLDGMYSGGTPTATNEELYCEDGTPFVSISDMSSCEYVLDTKKKLTELGIHEKNLRVLPTGTVLYSIYATVGAISELQISATISQAILALSLTNEIDKQWYKYNLRAMKDYIFFQANGNTQFNLNAEKVWNFSFVIPSLFEQSRIAAFLDRKCAEIDSVMADTRRTIEEYKALKQSIITEAVTKGVRGKRPMKDSGIEWLREVPSEWMVVRGKQVFFEINERSIDGHEELLTVSHITGVTPRSMKNVNMFMSESLVDYKICHVGDLASNTMWMWQGAIGVSKYEGVISPSYNTYRQRANTYNPEYLEYLLRIPALISTYAAYSTGITASRLRLYPDQFFSILFPVPSLDEQEEIVSILNTKVPEMDCLIERKEALICELESYKKSVIYEYVTGKKEVSPQ